MKQYVICGSDKGTRGFTFEAIPVEENIRIKPATPAIETQLWNAMRAGVKVIMTGDIKDGIMEVTDIKALK